MKKIIIGMFALAIMFIASPALASVESSSTNGYQAPCLAGDLVVYDKFGFPETCLPEEDVRQAEIDAQKYTRWYTGELITIPQGQSILTTFGVVTSCPSWFQMACVIDPALFVKFL